MLDQLGVQIEIVFDIVGRRRRKAGRDFEDKLRLRTGGRKCCYRMGREGR